MNVLLIESNDNLAYGMRLNLRLEGMVVTHHTSALAGLLSISSCVPDLILVDIDTPDTRGFDFIASLRNVTNVPVVAISSSSEEVNKVLALRLGADDYLTKPFGLLEFVERIKARLRRRTMPLQKSCLCVSSLRIELASMRVYVGAVELRFTPKELAVLIELTRANGAILSKRHLQSKVWGYSGELDTRTVDQHVRQVRNKLRSYGLDSLIETVHKQGFRLLLPGEERVA